MGYCITMSVQKSKVVVKLCGSKGTKITLEHIWYQAQYNMFTLSDESWVIRRSCLRSVPSVLALKFAEFFVDCCYGIGCQNL